MDMEKTGTYLASLRRGRDMTQQQVADILGVSNKTVSKWESGAGLPDIAALPALAALYGVTQTTSWPVRRAPEPVPIHRRRWRPIWSAGEACASASGTVWQ